MYKVYLTKHIRSMSVGIDLMKSEGMNTLIMNPAEMTEVAFAPSALEKEHSFHLPLGDEDYLLQAFMDAAWEKGLRPKGYEDNEGELKATKYHLHDMRTLALDIRKE